MVKRHGVDIIFEARCVFTDKNNGLKNLLENIFEMQQAHDIHEVHHNTLSREDMIALLNHNVCSMTHPTAYLNQLNLVVKVMFDVLPDCYGRAYQKLILL